LGFHPTQPIFASGGDDYKIKVWNLKTHTNATLIGHIDFIRTVAFHHDLPWLITCGDDQTIRIWNWQSRACVSVLTGHSHYVMSAFFHPKEDLIVSSSLDQTIRVWDYQGLKKKHSAGRPMVEDRFQTPGGTKQDVFGNMDCVVKYVLEGHSRGVNWAEFHPTLPLIISCADDRLIKLWRMNDSKAWEVDTCRGHYNNVSACMFSAKQDVILSCSEDKTIRVWDMTKRTCLQTFRREHDKLWCMTLHPESNLFAAGHENGLIVFKLERERPAFDIFQDTMFYVKDKTIRKFNFASASDTVVVNIKRGHVSQGPVPRTLSYNPAENAVLIQSGKEEAVFDMYPLPRDAQHKEIEPRRGNGNAAIYVARNRFATVEKGALFIKDLQNQVIKELQPTLKSGKIMKLNDVFFAGGKMVLVSSPNFVALYDVEGKQTVAEISITGVRYVSWNDDQSIIALISKHNITFCDRNLEQLCLIHETIKVKSGCWDVSGVFVYSTLNHIKFGLLNGDTGVIRTIEQPVYLVKVKNNLIHALTRQGKVEVIPFDPTEFRFKTALLNKKYDEVFHLIRTSNLMGQAIIGYLQKKGYPEIALQFVKDPKTRFDLAIECGNIDAALEMAKVIDKEPYWMKLGAEGLRQGNLQVVESVYQKTKNFDGLSFLYLVSGNTDRLKKMLKIAEARKDPMSRYQNSLWLGDVKDQVRNLVDAGQLSLAYLAAQTYGLHEDANSILEMAGLDQAPSILPNASCVTGPLAINKNPINWPLLSVSKSVFEHIQDPTAPAAVLEEADLHDVGDWGDDEIESPEKVKAPSPKKVQPEIEEDIEEFDEGEGWDVEADDLDIPELPPTSTVEFKAPKHGVDPAIAWKKSQVAAYHIACGSFDSAMSLLHNQIGAVEFEPIKPYFLTIYQASRTFVDAIAQTPPISSAIVKSWDETMTIPRIVFNLDSLVSQLQEVYPLMTAGKFSAAGVVFQKMLHEALFVQVNDEQQLYEVYHFDVVGTAY
jgi:coatomer subunit alpha